jgi:LysR family glycine cleavage system transcriptional activator
VPLFDYTLHPVCSPSVAASLGAEPVPAQLLQLPLVEIYSEQHNWDIWFEAAGLQYSSRPAIVVDTLAVALEIALEGRGVALVNGPYAVDDLAAGRLVRPVLICKREQQENERVRTFMDWLASEAAVSRGS